MNTPLTLLVILLILIVAIIAPFFLGMISVYNIVPHRLNDAHCPRTQNPCALFDEGETALFCVPMPRCKGDCDRFTELVNSKYWKEIAGEENDEASSHSCCCELVPITINGIMEQQAAGSKRRLSSLRSSFAKLYEKAANVWNKPRKIEENTPENAGKVIATKVEHAHKKGTQPHDSHQHGHSQSSTPDEAHVNDEYVEDEDETAIYNVDYLSENPRFGEEDENQKNMMIQGGHDHSAAPPSPHHHHHADSPAHS